MVLINLIILILVIIEIELCWSGEEIYSYCFMVIVGGVEFFFLMVQIFIGVEFLLNEGVMNVICWNVVLGVIEYCVYWMCNGVVGYIGFIMVGLVFVDDNILVDLMVMLLVQFGLFLILDNFFLVVLIYQQCLVFGVMNNCFEMVWFLCIGDYLNFIWLQNMVVIDRVEFDLVGEQLNWICGMLQFCEFLVFMLLGEFSVIGFEGGFDVINLIVM